MFTERDRKKGEKGGSVRSGGGGGWLVVKVRSAPAVMWNGYINFGAGGKHWHEGLCAFLYNHLWRHLSEMRKGQGWDVIQDLKMKKNILCESSGHKVPWDWNKQEVCLNRPWSFLFRARRPGAHRTLRSESLCRKDFSSQLSALPTLRSSLLIGPWHNSVSMHACLFDDLVDKLVIYYCCE